jgi:regulator of nucleoside diphosphate kinase
MHLPLDRIAQLFSDLCTMKLFDDQSQRVTYMDRCRLGQFLDSQDSRAWGNRRCRDKLEVVLEQARPVEAQFAPNNLVTMNSTVRLSDLLSKKRRTVTLVYPDDVDLASNSISILDPLGTALLGCKEGDVIQCPAEQCQRRFRIDEVVYQPEHAGAFHL